MMRKQAIKPLLLIGAQKSGSSYLFRLIEQDDQVARANLKGPKILSKPMHDGSDYLSHFNFGPQHRYVLDGSDSYLHVIGTAERASESFGPETPIIAVLRDPVERAVSAYLHEVKHGRELRIPEDVFNLPGQLSEAIDRENALIESSWRRGLVQPHLSVPKRYRDQLFGFRYVKNSLYQHQLEPWLSRFSNVRLLEFSKLRDDPLHVISKVRDWLGLPSNSSVEIDVPSNPTELRRWRALLENRLLKHDYIRPSLISTWRLQRELFAKLEDAKPSMPEDLALSLRHEFYELKCKSTAEWI